MRASQRRLCTDVQVMRGANCWTDHLMVRSKVCIDLAPAKGKSSIPFAVHDLGDEVKADAYCKCLSDHLKETPQNPGMSAEWNWRNLKLSVVKHRKVHSAAPDGNSQTGLWRTVTSLCPLSRRRMKHMRKCYRTTT